MSTFVRALCHLLCLQHLTLTESTPHTHYLRRWQMVSAGLDKVIEELADVAGMPDAKDIRNKMKRRMQNNRSSTAKTLLAMGEGYSLDVVDALIVRFYTNTPGAYKVQVTESMQAVVQDLGESGEDLLLKLYNHLVPVGHNTLKLDGVSDPRLLEDASD